MLRKILVVVGLIILISYGYSALWARAGGGESFGGGGGGSFGGDGGGEGIGALIYLLFWLVVNYPCIGIPLVIAVIIFLIFANLKGKGKITDRRLRKSNFFQNQYEVNQALEKIKQRDPNFNIDNFKQRVSRAFYLIQTAWSEQKLTKVHRFISDGVEERFNLQIKMQQAEGWRNVMENVKIQKIEVVSIESDQHFDTIHLAITARAKDYKVDLKTGRTLPQSKITEPFTEVWSWLRKPGVKTIRTQGAIEGNCPNCAAPLDITDAGKCRACGAFIRSGEYDWILSEITQESEWEVTGKSSEIPGFINLQQVDPGFSVQHIEDRTSVIFYRYQAALFNRSSKVLKKVVYSPAVERITRRLSGVPQTSVARYYKFPAIGKVEVLWIKPESELIKIFVLVKWSGSFAQRDLKTNQIKLLSSRIIYSDIYTLVRKINVASPHNAFNSAHCPNCGAPEVPDGTDSCPYCGTVLNDGNRSWVLADIEEFTIWLQSNREQWKQARSGVTADITGRPKALIEALAMMMASDGDIDQRELKMLKNFTGNYQISDLELRQIVDRVQQGQGIWKIPEDYNQGVVLLFGLIDMALSDGRISSPEKQLLDSVAKKLNIPSNILNQWIKDRQSSLIEFQKNYRKSDTPIPPPPPPQP
ncbi:MAG: TIM44-like domain-containing protein [bacterium]